MPTYEFRCSKCGEPFAVQENLTQHERHKEKCPKCGSRKVQPRISAIFVKTSKKS